MAQLHDTPEEEDSTSGNTFSNDGSFMEQFMKMQKEKKDTETKPEASTKNISMKLPPVKKLAPASLVQKRLKRLAAKKAPSSTGTNSEEKGESESKKETEPSATPSSTVAGDQSGASSSIATPPTQSSSDKPTTKGRKRKSKWDVGTATGTESGQAIHEAIGSFSATPSTSLHPVMLSGQQQQLTEAQLEQIKEQIAMQKMVTEIKAATQSQVGSKQNKYEYDSDEDTEDGTWEHKARIKEMKLTEVKAVQMTEMGKGKHHIGDFLPPEELEKFVETVNAVKDDRPPDHSDYKEHKLTEDNIGFKLLQKSGWDESKGLGAQSQGITAPVNKGPQSFDQSGLGAVKPAEVQKADSEYELYRKRMMLAYRFRPNPLNNPRRTYY